MGPEMDAVGLVVDSVGLVVDCEMVSEEVGVKPLTVAAVLLALTVVEIDSVPEDDFEIDVLWVKLSVEVPVSVAPL